MGGDDGTGGQVSHRMFFPCRDLVGFWASWREKLEEISFFLCPGLLGTGRKKGKCMLFPLISSHPVS